MLAKCGNVCVWVCIFFYLAHRELEHRICHRDPRIWAYWTIQLFLVILLAVLAAEGPWTQ